MARVQVVNSVTTMDKSDWHVCLQWCRYLYDDGRMEHGYRFIWVTQEGKLQPARGQARLPSLKLAHSLMEAAKAQGWGDYDAGTIDNAGKPLFQYKQAYEGGLQGPTRGRDCGFLKKIR